MDQNPTAGVKSCKASNPAAGAGNQATDSLHWKVRRPFRFCGDRRCPRRKAEALEDRPDRHRWPGVRNWDVTLFKGFGLRESWRPEFRTERFNAFNALRFGARGVEPVGTIVEQANSPVQVQFALIF